MLPRLVQPGDEGDTMMGLCKHKGWTVFKEQACTPLDGRVTIEGYRDSPKTLCLYYDSDEVYVIMGVANWPAVRDQIERTIKEVK